MELHPKAYFVVGAKTRRRVPQDKPVVIGGYEGDGNTTDPEKREDLGDESVVSELEYVQVSTGKDGGLEFVEYGT